jgi:hypothetical protein
MSTWTLLEKEDETETNKHLKDKHIYIFKFKLALQLEVCYNSETFLMVAKLELRIRLIRLTMWQDTIVDQRKPTQMFD